MALVRTCTSGAPARSSVSVVACSRSSTPGGVTTCNLGIVTCTAASLRRHDPNQVLPVEGSASPPLSPLLRTPVLDADHNSARRRGVGPVRAGDAGECGTA